MSDINSTTDLEIRLKENTKITKDDICSFINDTAQKYSLDNSITKITFDNNKGIGSYNPNNLCLNINYDLLNRHYKDVMEFNIQTIICIFHEMTHAAQRYQIFSETTYKRLSTYYILLFTCYITSLNNFDMYLKKYDTFITEYTANICSYINTLKLLRRNKINKEVIKKVNQEFASKINEYYNNNTPINNAIHLLSDYSLANKIDNMNIDNNIKEKYKYAFRNYGEEKDLTNIEKLIYGYYLNNKSVKVLDNIEQGKIKTMDLIKRIGT